MIADETTAFVVRPAQQDDLPLVAAIERVSFADPWTEESFASTLALPHIRFLVAEERAGEGTGRGGLLGYVVAMILGDEGEIADLAVAPAARRRGIGGLLLDRIALDAADRGVVALFLEVRESNAAARALYRSRSFEAVGRRRGYYRQPVEDALLLRRDLAPG